MSTFTRAKADSLRHGPVRKRAGGGIDFDDERYFSHAIGGKHAGGPVTEGDERFFSEHQGPSPAARRRAQDRDGHPIEDHKRRR